MTLALQKINISHFRGYDAQRLDLSLHGAPAPMVVLTGPNGAGKTNVLEAVSLLVPGKGLRGAELQTLKNRQSAEEDLWAVAAEVETQGGLTARIGTGMDAAGKRRLIRINGKDAKSQGELSGLISAVWLTPQMDRLFLEGPAARRKFLDRLVFAFAPAHMTALNRYEKAMRERMKLLQQEKPADPQWLTELETQMAAEAVAVAAGRIALLAQLQGHVAALGAAAPLFPQPAIHMRGWVEEEIQKHPALAVEDALKQKLKQNRNLDRATGRTQDGTHRSDMEVFYAAHGMPAAECSTGEQKALLVSIVLAHARMMQAEKGFVPLILLDEVAAHLDDARRAQLFEQLRTLQGQIWLTGTDAAIFAPLNDVAKCFHVEEGRITARQEAPRLASVTS